MPVLAYEGRDIAIDEDGFLLRFQDWTESIARALAEREGIQDLTRGQLDIMRVLRRYYETHAFFPIIRFVCDSAGQRRNCITEAFKDPVTAWKVAGLPNPGEEVRTFQSWEPLGF
jgi:TusE/DsrC/DsvC family sulfur relay protein